MKALEWSQKFSHCKYMEIFPDAQGQLTPQSKFDMLEIQAHPILYGWVSLLSTRMKKIQSKMKGLE